MDIFISNVCASSLCGYFSIGNEYGGEGGGVGLGGLSGKCIILAENSSSSNYSQYILTIKVLQNYVLWSMMVCEVKVKS